MRSTQIGIATIHFDPNGVARDADFTPTLKVQADTTLLASFATVSGKTQEESLRTKAELMLAKFFNKSTEIELADRDKYEIRSQTIKCLKYSNGNIKEVVIVFSFQELVV